MKRSPLFATVALFSLVSLAPLFAAETMDTIESTGKIKIGWRDSSSPFASLNAETGKHEGFCVDMGNLIVEMLTQRFGKKIEGIPVTIASKDRLPKLIAKEIDIEMGNTTHTQARDRDVDFSLTFFVSETTFLLPKDSKIKSVNDLNGKRIGAVKGSTNLIALNNKIAEGIFAPKGELLQVEKHDDGLAALELNTLDLYCGDRSILEGLKKKAAQPDLWRVADFAIAYEPYGFMVRKGNSDLRDFVDNTLVWTIQTGKFQELYDKWMGPKGVVPIPMSKAYQDYLQLINYPLKKDWWKKPALPK
jgi:ABC-type amino acid transport substrate-binding protein